MMKFSSKKHRGRHTNDYLFVRCPLSLNLPYFWRKTLTSGTDCIKSSELGNKKGKQRMTFPVSPHAQKIVIEAQVKDLDLKEKKT